MFRRFLGVAFGGVGFGVRFGFIWFLLCRAWLFPWPNMV